jgi:hypothetical protein
MPSRFPRRPQRLAPTQPERVQCTRSRQRLPLRPGQIYPGGRIVEVGEPAHRSPLADDLLRDLFANAAHSRKPKAQFGSRLFQSGVGQ